MLLIHIFNRTDSKFARKRKKKKNLGHERNSFLLSRRRRQGLQALSLNESLLSCQRMEQWCPHENGQYTHSLALVRVYILCYTCTTPVPTFARASPNDFSRGNLERDWYWHPVFWIPCHFKKGRLQATTRGDIHG